MLNGVPPINPKRVFYVAGPGDAVGAHRHWIAGRQDPTEVSVTFSSQVEQYCRDVGAALYIVCYHKRRDFLQDGDVRIEHWPKFWPLARGGRYHLREVLYGLGLLQRAIRFRADVAILDSGCTHYFVQSLFALAGIKVVPVLHNALWPEGFRPRGVSARVIQTLDRLFFRRSAFATICVSPVCERQVRELARATKGPLVQARAQYLPGYFDRIPPAPPHDRRPFQIMFIGRIVESKGVLDIAEMARYIEDRAAGRVRWVICGTGETFEALQRRVQTLKLEAVIRLTGWITLENLANVYAGSHCSIVPTRSTFVEGMAMTAVEAILAGRPIISNPVVPALEVLRPAAIAARTNEPLSYAEEILKLIDDPDRYRSMVDACAEVSRPFLDPANGLTHVLKAVLNGASHERQPAVVNGKEKTTVS